ncbi:MAG: RluA family pseudouridine synthase [Clostridiales bacterium]|nr:RluA family pseudouridine synthase [Clostridiales bacterium]
MRQLTVKEYESGQRLDRYLGRYLKEASKGFLYKMLRKKNITLNGKKADGTERLETGDCVRLFLSEETLEKFMGKPEPEVEAPVKKTPEKKELAVLYETTDVVFINKPVGMLSQKAKKEDVSVCEYLVERMVNNGELTREGLRTFRPGVCNRLDRNTSGVIAAGKSLRGLQGLSAMFRDRSMDKYYLCLVHGRVKQDARIRGYLVKDELTNTVKVYSSSSDRTSMIETEYHPLAWGENFTLLEVKLITGKTHQIRAHLASQGHPILGDSKYGNEKVNREFRERFPLRCQLLHSWKLVFPKELKTFPELEGKTITAPLPPAFSRCLQILGISLPS